MKRRVVSIFSGIDCLGLGFRKNFDVVLAVEQEKKACEILNANKKAFHPNLEVWNRDVCSVSEDEIRSLKNIDGIIGGPPCQPFSAARGCFNPNDDKIKLIYEYLRWVKLIKPKFFLMENVEGLLQKGKIAIFESFLEQAQGLGYKLYYKLINCHEYGSPQKRNRIIVVGFRDDLDIDFDFPKPVDNKKYVRDILDTDFVGECMEVRDRIKEIMPHVPEGGYWKHLKTDELLEKALGVNYKKRNGGMTGTCRRLHRDKPCPTLVTSPVQNTTLLYHPTEERALSITEYKRAQGIPEEYDITGVAISNQYRFIGNGVPVEVGQVLSKAILKSLNNMESKVTNNINLQNIQAVDYKIEIEAEKNNQLCFVL